MREIKFRAWDKKHGNMFKPTFVDMHGALWNLMVDNVVVKRSTESVLMQYTGLKDKNGVEVYEGDIVRQGNGKLSWNWVVDWEFSLKATDRMDDEYEIGSGYKIGKQVSEVKVIGNIYENPELLEQS